MLSNNALISVIMCVYNTPIEYLKGAVLSIINQTYNNWELLIVDDNSNNDLFSDNLFSDKRIKILKNKENHGPAYSRNRALQIATGKYIAIMDSDDISLPNRIEEQIKFLEEHTEVVACGTWFKFTGEKNHEVKRAIDNNDYYRCCLLFGNVPTLLNSSMMIRKSALDEYKIQYNDELHIGEDYLMWVQLSEIGIVTNIKKILVYYRVHTGQTTNIHSKENNSSQYDAKVKLLQLGRISDDFSQEEKNLFIQKFSDRKVKPVKYYRLLSKIRECNKKSGYFDQVSLEKRIDEQWEAKIKCVNNPFSLFYTWLICAGKRRIISIKIKQIRNKIFRKKDE